MAVDQAFVCPQATKRKLVNINGQELPDPKRMTTEPDNVVEAKAMRC